MKEAKKYGKNYWDGKRRFGYGGYKYIPGRWRNVAKKLIKIYKLKAGSKILDVGCGKGFLLHEILKLQPKIKIYGFDISLYIKSFIGKKIIGQNSGVSAFVKFVAFQDDVNVDDLTIYVTYLSGDNDSQLNPFSDGEPLICDENVTYGNTTINAGTPFASLISSDATAIGSAAFILSLIHISEPTRPY